MVRQGKKSIMHGKGPGHIVVAAAARIGWVFKSGTEILDDLGQTILIGEVCPRSAGVLADDAVIRFQRLLFSEHQGREDYFNGGLLEPIRKLLAGSDIS